MKFSKQFLAVLIIIFALLISNSTVYGKNGHAIADAGPWVATRVVGIESIAAERAVIVGHVVRITGDPVGELGQDRFCDDDGAGRAEVLGNGCWHVRRVDVVLERYRNAVQRTAYLTGCALGIEAFGICERVRIDRDRRIQEILVERDTCQVLLDERSRCRSALGHCALHLGDRGFNDVERHRRLSGSAIV